MSHRYNTFVDNVRCSEGQLGCDVLHIPDPCCDSTRTYGWCRNTLPNGSPCGNRATHVESPPSGPVVCAPCAHRHGAPPSMPLR